MTLKTRLDNLSQERTKVSKGDALAMSFEFFPPRTKDAEDRLLREIRVLETRSPKFVSVTYGAGGGTRKNTLSTASRLAAETSIPSAAHLTCVGVSRDEANAVAREIWHAGIRHIVAIRGDPQGGASVYEPHPRGYPYAADLVAGLKQIAGFEISVAAYPEVHPEALSAAQDMDALKRKIDAGATRAITQFFFDNESFRRFVDRTQAAGIKVPIVAGLMPITDFERVRRFARHCRVAIPDQVAARFDGLEKAPAEIRHLAKTVAAEQCRELYALGQRDFHIYTMNDLDIAASIHDALRTSQSETERA